MAGKCSICSSDKLSEIEHDIIAGIPIRIIADQYGISLGAINRHKAGHISPALIEAKAIEEVSRSGDLLETTMSLLGEAQSITAESRQAGDLRTALDGIGKITNILKLLTTVTLALAERKDNETDLTQSSEFIQVRTKIIQALQDCPGCRKKVSEALKHV